MEPTKFDDLTKALATATSRRQALKALGAAVGGALAFSRIGIAFAAKCQPDGHHCSFNKQCCSGLCQNHTCVSPCSSSSYLCNTAAPSFCGSNGTCLCAADVNGSTACVALVAPICTSPCMSDTDCGAKQVCVQAACCPTVNGSTGVCQPRC